MGTWKDGDVEDKEGCESSKNDACLLNVKAFVSTELSYG